jgi:hypothetical protein
MQPGPSERRRGRSRRGRHGAAAVAVVQRTAGAPDVLGTAVPRVAPGRGVVGRGAAEVPVAHCVAVALAQCENTLWRWRRQGPAARTVRYGRVWSRAGTRSAGVAGMAQSRAGHGAGAAWKDAGNVGKHGGGGALRCEARSTMWPRGQSFSRRPGRQHARMLRPATGRGGAEGRLGRFPAEDDGQGL